jgi:glycosyltransferase involved in cell wall biosynthesis
VAGSPEICVEFDGAAFLQHRRSGISRYFAELIAAYDASPELAVDVSTPYRYVTNLHLAASERRFRSLPVPRRLRGPVLTRLNGRASRRARPPDVVHAPLYDPAVLERLGAARLVTTVYDFTFEMFPELFGDVGDELANKSLFLDRAHALVCISQATAEDLKRFHPDLDVPVVVAPLAVADEFFNPGERKVPGMPEKYLLHVGNRAVHKNTEAVLRAFADLKDRRTDLHLVMSGAGVPGETERIAELGISERTHLVKVSDAHLPSLYRNAAAFVFPSRYEGFGLPVLEAMAAGCPAVVSDTPALTEVVEDAAAVAKLGDQAQLVAGIEQILDDPVHRESLRQAGLQRARQFSWRRTAELTRVAYDQALRT